MTKIATTTQLLEMSELSTGSYKLPSDVKQNIDPQGHHIVVTHMLHNDSEIRARFFIKINGSDEHSEAVVDCPIKMFNELQSIGD